MILRADRIRGRVPWPASGRARVGIPTPDPKGAHGQTVRRPGPTVPVHLKAFHMVQDTHHRLDALRRQAPAAASQATPRWGSKAGARDHAAGRIPTILR
jgi:hypothetical protein